MRFHASPKSPLNHLRAVLFGGAATAALLAASAAFAQAPPPSLMTISSPITKVQAYQTQASPQPQTSPPQAASPATPAPQQNVSAQVQNETSIQLPSLAPLVDRVSPAVVTITAHLSTEAANDKSSELGNEGSSDPSESFDDLLRRFFEQRGMPRGNRDVVALGSGFIIDPAGYIVTNQHVVGTSDKVTVVLHDNSRHSAKIIGRDEKTDLALIKIDAPDKLPYVSWGDSDKSKVGDWVVAVGNPFGLGGTVTAGIISALGRNINEGPYDDFIQIDAPINRGNSGGPTFDLSGHVIAINTAIYSPSGGSVGIGFAIPANVAKPIIAQLRDHGHVVRGWLGVAIQGITPPIAKSLGIDPNAPNGALVATVTPDSPAARAGLKQGDVILSANGHPIKSVNDLPRLVANTPVGQKLELQVRRNGKDTTVEAQVAEMRDKNKEQQAASNDNNNGAPERPAESLGLALAPIDPAVRARFRIPRDVEGVVVAAVSPDSPFAEIGLQPGDVIQSVDQHPVKTPAEAAEQLKAAADKGNVLMLLNRHGSSQFVGLSVGGDSTKSGSSRER